MRYADPEAFRAAIDARLRSGTDQYHDLARRRRIIAFDRFLVRLAAADQGAWLLKGGAALEFRQPDRARSTRDVDLSYVSAADPVDALLEAVAVDAFGDYFAFGVTRRRELADAPDRGRVVRLSIDALLGGRVFEQFVVDIAPGVAVTASRAIDTIDLGAALAFAGLPLVAFPVIDLRAHWAEKLSAYCRRYDDRPNTRVKDLVDLVLLIDFGLEPDRRLYETVQATFANREQSLPSSDLPSMAAEWAEPFAVMAAEVALDTTESGVAHTLIETFWRRTLDASTNEI